MTTATATPDATSVATSAASSVAAAAVDASAHTASTAAEASGATPPPQYRTQPAPAATLLFDLKRGLAGGQAVLQWRPDISAPSHTGAATGSYSLTLQAQAFGIAVAAWNSSGRFDAAGLAPDRYAESRRSREVRATHFQRATDKITFSAQVTEFALPAGVQDRSSWMLQLGAILQAHPELAQPGAQVSLWVVGTRGAPEPWLFTVQSRAALALGSSDELTPVATAVHLIREPRRPYDTRASVWLDPARHHLPVKVQMLVQGTGEGQEFELRQLTLP